VQIGFCGAIAFGNELLGRAIVQQCFDLRLVGIRLLFPTPRGLAYHPNVDAKLQIRQAAIRRQDGCFLGHSQR
jgi:hypothetical protein